MKKTGNIRTVLITGGAGFVGINLVDRLLESRQYKITIIDNLSEGNYPLLRDVVKARNAEPEESFSQSLDRVTFYREDITNRKAAGLLLKGQEQVVHLAAQTGVIPSMADPMKDAAINIDGTLNLLSASVDHQVRTFIFASSAAPLGEQTPPLDETKIPCPLSPYGASKAAAEAYCSAYFGTWGLGTVVLRFSNLYGPYSFHKGSVIAAFMKALIHNRPILVYGDGEQTRDFLYTGDLTRAIHSILQHDSDELHGQLFQMGAGTETSINRLIRHLKSVTGIEPVVKYQPERKGEVKRNCTSIEKIKRFIGYQPEFELEDGLKATWEWFKNFESEQ